MAERRPLVMIGGSLRELPDGDSIAMTRVWQSGMTVAQGERVISPLDWEEYRRTAATGGGAVDPADDIANYQSVTYPRVTSLGGSASIASNNSGNTSLFANGAIKITPATISVGTRTEIFSATGRGYVGYLGFQKANTGGGRFEVLADDRSIFDASIQTLNNEFNIIIGASGSGGTSTTSFAGYVALPESPGIPFRRSFRVFYTPVGASTNTSTVLAYILRAVR